MLLNQYVMFMKHVGHFKFNDGTPRHSILPWISVMGFFHINFFRVPSKAKLLLISIDQFSLVHKTFSWIVVCFHPRRSPGESHTSNPTAFAL